MRSSTPWIVCVVAAGVVAGVRAQQPAPGLLARQPALKPVTHTVRIDALVADARGSAVTDLKAADLDVLEDGQPVTIDDLRLVRVAAQAPAPAGPPTPIESAKDEQQEARRDDVRLVAIYLDEYHLTPGPDVDHVREALTEFVDHQLDPRDLLVVMKPLDSLFTIRLTRDRDEARQLIAGLEGRKGDYAPRTEYERNYMAGTQARIEAARTQVGVSALNALAVHMGSLSDQRKSLLVVSEGLTRPVRSRGQEYLATIESVTRAANRANVSIYPIDPLPGEVAVEPSADHDAVLKSLAADTDGRLFNSDELASATRHMLDEASAYYVITYRSAHVENGAFHPVELRPKRAGLRLRARAGFWSPSQDDRLRAELLALADAPPVRLPLEPARHISDLIQPWFGVAMGDAGKTRVTFVWEPAPRVPGDRSRVTATHLELTVLGTGDAIYFQGAVRPTGPGMIEEQAGEASRAVFDVPPGRLRLRMRIQDAARREIDTDVRDLSIRDLRSELSIGTAEFLRARNAREFKELDGDPEAVPVSSREFSRTEHLIVRFPAYAPKGQTLAVTARLLNRAGQPMRTLDLRAGTADGDHELDIPLAGLASGDYQLELAAASSSSRVKELFQFRVTS